jgi:hypothetical protein
MQKPKKLSPKVRIRGNLDIGKAAAEHDEQFLYECFIDTGHYYSAIDKDDARFLVVGRTGSGKTALLKMVERNKQNVIRIDPTDLSLQHLSNSDIVQFITKLGLRIDPFFEMLWRYTFAVELLRAKYNISDHEAAKTRFFQVPFKTKRKRALDLLRGLSPEFWKTVDVRVAQASRRLESDVKGALGGEFSGVKISAEGARKLTEEQRIDVQHRVQNVIGAETLSALQDVIHFLAEEVFDDDQAPYYIIIDDLDREFAEDDVRVRLIKTLIESVIKMRPIKNVKFLIGIRADLLEMVFEKTRDASFQQEKYEDCSLHIRWSYDELFEVVNSRINTLYRRAYTKDSVRFYDVFSSEVARKPTREYILERTLMRPRDAILFVNECFREAQNSVNIAPNLVKQAEARYSAGRFNSLRDEWRVLYPRLEVSAQPLRGRHASFRLGEVTKDEVEELLVALSLEAETGDRLAVEAALHFGRSAMDVERFKRSWAFVMYKVGIIGVKPAPHLAAMWSYRDPYYINESHFHEDAKISVHKMLWHELGARATHEAD